MFSGDNIEKFYAKGKIVKEGTIDDIIEELNIEEKWNVYYRKIDTYVYDHTYDPGCKDWEPIGEYILLGKGRDNLPQFQVNGTGNTTFIGSVFTFGFLVNPEKGGCITYSEIPWNEFDDNLSKMHENNMWRRKDEIYVNFIGHDQTAQLLGEKMNRITIRAQPGDTVIWAQYKGPRLEEGMTTVPEDAEFIPMKAEIYDNKIRQIINKIKQLL